MNPFTRIIDLINLVEKDMVSESFASLLNFHEDFSGIYAIYYFKRMKNLTFKLISKVSNSRLNFIEFVKIDNSLNDFISNDKLNNLQYKNHISIISDSKSELVYFCFDLDSIYPCGQKLIFIGDKSFKFLTLKNPELFIYFKFLILKSNSKLRSNLNYTNDSQNRMIYLNSREQIVFAEIQKGLTNKQIARKLGYSESTIRQDTIKIYKKLNLSGREAIFK